MEEPQEVPKEIAEPVKEEPQIIEESNSDDPFEGIDTDDINKYADLYDVPPPETDDQAKEMAQNIRKWISQGRPKPGEEPKQSDNSDDSDTDDSEKTKKKRSLFGRFRK